MKKIEEFDFVVLTKDLINNGLKEGDVGTVVDIHQNGEGFTVEFMTHHGQTVAVLTLLASDIQAIEKGEMSHSRSLAA